MLQTFDSRLQLVLEPHANLPWLIQEAVRGGVTCIQWRDKFFSDRNFYEQALRIQALCKELKVPLIINDRVDIALAINADAVHLGQRDMPFEVVRKLLPAHIAIGLSAESLEDVEKANELDLAYLAISPVFHTLTKSDIAPEFGLEGLRKARQISRHKLVTIGGVNLQNARELREAGADGLAVVSAICRSKHPYEAAKGLLA